MKKSTRRDDDQGEIVGRLRRIPDFFPPPSELARADRPETVKVTLDLDREAVEWFKREANHTAHVDGGDLTPPAPHPTPGEWHPVALTPGSDIAAPQSADAPDFRFVDGGGPKWTRADPN